MTADAEVDKVNSTRAICRQARIARTFTVLTVKFVPEMLQKWTVN